MDRGAKSSGLPAASVSLAVAPCGQAVNRPGGAKNSCAEPGGGAGGWPAAVKGRVRLSCRPGVCSKSVCGRKKRGLGCTWALKFSPGRKACLRLAPRSSVPIRFFVPRGQILSRFSERQVAEKERPAQYVAGRRTGTLSRRRRMGEGKWPWKVCGAPSLPNRKDGGGPLAVHALQPARAAASRAVSGRLAQCLWPAWSSWP